MSHDYFRAEDLYVLFRVTHVANEIAFVLSNIDTEVGNYHLIGFMA